MLPPNVIPPPLDDLPPDDVATDPEVVVSSTFFSFFSLEAFFIGSFLSPSLSTSRKSGLAPSLVCLAGLAAGLVGDLAAGLVGDLAAGLAAVLVFGLALLALIALSTDPACSSGPVSILPSPS